MAVDKSMPKPRPTKEKSGPKPDKNGNMMMQNGNVPIIPDSAKVSEEHPHALISFSWLNEAQNVFVRTYLMNGRIPLDAYRASYDNNMSDPAARVRAYAMLQFPGIRMALAEVEKSAAAALSLTLKDHLIELGHLRDMAKNSRQYAAAITAEVSRGKAAGLYVTRLEHSGKDGLPIGLAQVSTKEYEDARNKILADC